MGLVKTRRLVAMQKQQKAKAGMRSSLPLNRHSDKFVEAMKSVQLPLMIESHDNDRRNAHGTGK